MAEAKAETTLEEIKRRRDEREKRKNEDLQDGFEFGAIRSGGIADGLEIAIEILEAKGE